MRKCWFIGFFFLASCTGIGEIKRGDIYTSSFAGFKCGPFQVNTKVQAAFGPHGGTVRFVDDFRMFTVDVEEFQPALDKAALANSIDRLYPGYLAESTIPLIKSGIPNASLVKEALTTIGGALVYQSVILTPGNSPAVDGEGRRLDGLRGLVQYTNGHYIFTVTELGVAWPNRSREEQIESIIKNAQESYRLCSFPT